MANQNANQVNLGAALSLEGRVEVYPAHGMPELNGAGGPAYEARLKSDVTQSLYAVICMRDFLPRIEDVNAMRQLDTGAVRLIDAGPMHWPEQGAHYYTFVFEKPSAARFWNSLDVKQPTMTEDNMTQSFIRPLAKTLQDFKTTGAAHGGIRPTNIFWVPGSSTPPQLGECMSAPCGIGQHAMFETIERAMCTEEARGPCDHADDCYAFGATIALMILGKNPFQGMSDAEIIRLKLDKGSFNAFIGSRSLPSSQIELLRGLLTDDAMQRWDANEIDLWASGRRQTARNSDAGKKASRQFKIAGKDYWRAKSLAWALSQNVTEAVKIIEDGSLSKWIARSLGDDERLKDLNEVVEGFRNAGAKASHYQDQLVARVCIALDPAAPIRYRGLSVTPQGIGPYMAFLMRTGGDLQLVGEIITSKFVTLWVNMQRDAKTDLVPLAQQMERMNTVLEKTTYGEGMECVLYELNPAAPCLSPMLKNECVLKPKGIMAALERVASTGAHGSEPMDRHLAGFLIARERRSSNLFMAMDPSEPVMRRGLALLTLLGEMQYRHGPDKVPRLAAWIMPLMEACIGRYLSKPFQAKVREQAKKASDRGDLAMLLKVIDDPSRVSGDEQAFLQARQMYAQITYEIAGIEKAMKDKKHAVQNIGKPVAASIASILALIFMGLTIMRAVMQGIG